MDPYQKAEPDLALPKGKAFWIGIALMVMSFGPFGFYFVIPFLPVSSVTMLRLFVAGLIASWGLFFIGTLLAGKDGYTYLRQLFRKRFQKR